MSKSRRHLYRRQGIKYDLYARDITEAVGEWITEAMVLSSLGMPEGSYTLTFDGGPTRDYTANVFKTVHRDVNQQSAFEICHARGYFETTKNHKYNNAFIYDDLPKGLELLETGKGNLLRCNFDVTSDLDPVTLAEERQHWTLDD